MGLAVRFSNCFVPEVFGEFILSCIFRLLIFLLIQVGEGHIEFHSRNLLSDYLRG